MTTKDNRVQTMRSVYDRSIYSCILYVLTWSFSYFPEYVFYCVFSSPSFISFINADNPLLIMPPVPNPLPNLAAVLLLRGEAIRNMRIRIMMVISFIQLQQFITIVMRFGEDSMQDFINYKLNNPQALQQQMRMIKDRQDCVRKLNDYAKQMQNLKNEYNMYKQLYDASVAKREYLNETYEQSMRDVDMKINNYREQIEYNNRQIRQREGNNELIRKNYNDFQKQIALKKDRLTQYHLNQLTTLFNQSQILKSELQQKYQRKYKLQEELNILKDRQRIIQSTLQNTTAIKNKWITRKNQVQRMREEEIRKQKEIRDQINNAISMEKVIYGNFYKRCAQITTQMRDGLERLFNRDFATIQGSNLEQKLQKMLVQLKVNRQNLLNYIAQKRQKFKIGPSLPEADAEVFNNIVETKINPQLLMTINKQDYKNNDYLLKEIEDGLTAMFEKMEVEKSDALERQNQKMGEIRQLQQKIREFETQIEAKRKTMLSPSKKSKKY